MSDHILLAACVHAALVSEAYFAVEFLRRSRPGSAARLLASVALVAAVALSVLVSIESYYTSRCAQLKGRRVERQSGTDGGRAGRVEMRRGLAQEEEV